MTPTPPPEVVIEICGEGKTDVAKKDASPVPATEGVVTVLVRRLCDNPPNLRVRRSPLMFLQKGKGFVQKVRFFKQNARISGAAGCVFVMDSEGNPAAVRKDLEQGRDHSDHEFPMTLGVAHPCIESWLLSDPSAVRRGLGLQQRPTVPLDPESLPAPAANRAHNPKTVLEGCHPNRRHPNLAEKTLMADHLTLATAEQVCPSFAAFAADVRARLGHLFPPLPVPPAPTTAGDDPADPSA